MTKLEKAKFLEERNIEWMIGKGRTMYALVKMSTHAGDDCSEWLDASDVIEQIQEQEKYFKSYNHDPHNPQPNPTHPQQFC